MTPNRALKRAARAIAAASDIRLPEAEYLADHRKLRLPDGAIHDFSTGPLRLLGIKGSGIGQTTSDISDEAIAKGWVNVRFSSKDRAGALGDLSRIKNPALIFVDANRDTGTARHEIVDALDAGEHPDLNVVIIREPAPGETPARPAHESGRNIHFNAPANRPAERVHHEAPPGCQHFAYEESGLVLITGATGSGRTTTAAALTHLAVRERPDNARVLIITDAMEAPLEPLITPGVSVIQAWSSAERVAALTDAAPRAEGLVIYLDEIPDPATFEAAMDAALAGALVFTTAHGKGTNAAAGFVQGLPEDRQKGAAAKLESSLRGFVHQQIVNNARGLRMVKARTWTAGDTEATVQVLPMTSKPTERDLAPLRIAFARRYADILHAESVGINTGGLDALADDLAGIDNPAAGALADIVRGAAGRYREGCNGADTWTPHTEILGRHLVAMLAGGASPDATATVLRTAAETIEADLRTGII